jgi:hypothetical protein
MSSHTFTPANSTSASLPFHIPEKHHTVNPGSDFTQTYPNTSPTQTPSRTHINTNNLNQFTNNTQHTPQPQYYMPEIQPNNHNAFSISIVRPKLDFPSFTGEEPVNWLRMCEKYFALAAVPMETCVSLATLHCHDVAQTWWRSLRTPVNFVHWGQFCNMVCCRFSTHITHSSLENFHHLKQSASVTEYIQKFEELMALMQMEYPGLTE